MVQRKVISWWGGRKTVAAARGRRSKTMSHMTPWFGDWFSHTPPWWATRRAHETKRRGR